MRRVIQLLLAATTLMTASRVSARFGVTDTPKLGDSVDFQTFELDGEVRNILWCGNNDEIILLLSSDGSIYRSRDRGASWKRLK